MALPIVSTIATYDAANEKVIEFSWTGNQSMGNRIVITNITTNAIVYDNYVATYKLEHTIPAALLKNGTQYACQVSTTDGQGVTSSLSNKTFFYCMTTPTWKFIDLVDKQIVANSSITLSMKYEQSDWDDLKSFQFFLYNSSKTLIAKSPVSYDTTNMTYTFKGLEDSNKYYVRATGTSIRGLDCDTGYINITVSYLVPSKYQTLYLTNNANKGTVTCKTNFIVIEGSETTSYDYDNGCIVLSSTDLVYNAGFSASGDFTLKIPARVSSLAEGERIKLTGKDGNIGVSFMKLDDGTAKFKLKVTNKYENYVKYTTNFTYNGDDMVVIIVRRKSNLYSISAIVHPNTFKEAQIIHSYARPKNITTQVVWIQTDDTTEATTAVDMTKYQRVIQDTEPDKTTLNNYDLWISTTT